MAWQPAEKLRAWKTHLQLPPFAAPAFATFLACLATPVSTYVCCQMVFLCQLLWLAFGRFPKINPGLEKHPCSFHPWPLLWRGVSMPVPLISTWPLSENKPRAWKTPLQLPLMASTQGLKNTPAASTLGHSCFCHVPGLHVWLSACWAWNFHFSTVQKVTLDSAVCGLAPCSFHPWPQGFEKPPAASTLGQSCFCHVPGCLRACWAWNLVNFHFSTAHKMTLDSAVCGLGQPAETPRAWKKPRSWPACCLSSSRFHPRLLLNGVFMPVPLVSTWPLSEGQPRAWKKTCNFHSLL